MKITQLLLCAILLGLAPQAQAEDAKISIELDSLKQAETSCRLTFVAQNTFDTDVKSIVLEMVAFDTNEGVASMTLFDFQKLPAGGTRVRQFDLPNMKCKAVGSLLINGVQACDGDVDCEGALSVSSRTDVALQG